jgi:hypothetical protein
MAYAYYGSNQLQGLGSYLSVVGLTTSADTQSSGGYYMQQRQMAAMQQNVANYWDFTKPATLTYTDNRKPNGVKYLESGNILFRLREETKDFIGNRM